MHSFMRSLPSFWIPLICSVFRVFPQFNFLLIHCTTVFPEGQLAAALSTIMYKVLF